MKKTDIRWLGEIPEHWDIRRLKYVLRERDTRSEHGTEQLLRVSQFTGVTERKRADGVEEPDTRAESLIGYKKVEPNDLVVNIMLAWNGSMGVSAVSGIASPAYCVYHFSDSVDPRYFHYLLRSELFKARIKALSTGVVESRLRLYTDDLYRLEALVPPPVEQAAIVRFLDHATHRIRLYIRAKQNLIKLLEEQKQSVTHRAVTRGLDPSVRLTPSGVEWLGDVPGHWQVMATRHRYTQVLGKMLDTKRITGDHSLPYLRNTDVQWDRINVDDLPRMDIPESEYSRYTLLPGDLVVCEGGEIGRCAIWNEPLKLCAFQKALHRLRPVSTSADTPRFMYYALRAAANAGAFSDGHVSTIPHLTGDKLRAHQFPFPPKREQDAIVAFLDEESGKIDQACLFVNAEISTLRELLSRLVADAVTGRLDVRAAAKSLPAESSADQIDDMLECAADTPGEEFSEALEPVRS